MMIRTTCKKCGVTLKLDFGELTKEEALAIAEKMEKDGIIFVENLKSMYPDVARRELEIVLKEEKRHFEFGGFRRLWSLDAALHRAYDLGEGEDSTPVMTDREYVENLIAQGLDMIDGGLNTVPEMKLPCLLDFRGLRHIGFGHFEDNTGLFLRYDSPRGTRFYEYVPDAIPVSIPA